MWVLQVYNIFAVNMLNAADSFLNMACCIPSQVVHKCLVNRPVPLSNYICGWEQGTNTSKVQVLRQ